MDDCLRRWLSADQHILPRPGTILANRNKLIRSLHGRESPASDGSPVRSLWDLERYPGILEFPYQAAPNASSGHLVRADSGVCNGY